MSFHGCQDCGQTLILDVLGSSLWAPAHRRACVHMVEVNMLDQLSAERHTKVIVDDVIKTLSQCPRAVLYFDEIDMMTPAQHDTVVALVKNRAYNSSLPSPNLAIFVFLSGAGSQTLLELGIPKLFARDAVSLGIAQHELIKLFQPKSSFWNHPDADKINWPKVALRLEQSVLSFVPFFPMRRVDIRACLRGETMHSLATLKEHKLIASYSVDERVFDWFVEQWPHAWTQKPPYLTKKGCKSPTELVGSHIYGGVQHMMKAQRASPDSEAVGPYAQKHIHVAPPPAAPAATPHAEGDADADAGTDADDGAAKIAIVAAFDGAPPRNARELEKELARQYRVMMREFKRSQAEAKQNQEVLEDGSILQHGDGAAPSRPSSTTAFDGYKTQGRAPAAGQKRPRFGHSEL